MVNFTLSKIKKNMNSNFNANLGTSFNDNIYVITAQPNEQILISGAFTEFNENVRNGLVRLNLDGTEDSTFYNNLGSGFNNLIYAMAVQPDGKILVGGCFTEFNGNIRNRFVRLNPDGTEDSVFCNNLGTSFDNTISAITVQPDGKILVGGYFTKFNGNTRYGLVRLNSNGTEDFAFCDNLGKGFNDMINVIVVQGDEKILVGGVFDEFNKNERYYLVRLNSNGSEDTDFYNNLGTSFDNAISTIKVQSNGKILIGGYFTEFNENVRNGLVRLNSNGTEDFAFYDNLGIKFDNEIYTIAIQPNEKILIGGYFTEFNENVRNKRNKLIRLNFDGTVDSAFCNTLGSGFNKAINAIVAQSDGKILIGGAFTKFNGVKINHFICL
jgi:uncharacterized delta-60 repeat protein